MVNKEFRDALNRYLEESEETTVLLDNSAFDNSIIGITENGRLIYSYDKMVIEYAEDNNCDLLDAMEWVNYNTLRSLPYAGEKAPIIIMETKESILERYGG